jgi:predicted ArsR family transcriptional regulator
MGEGEVNLDSRILQLLQLKALSLSEIAESLEVSPTEVRKALYVLKEKYLVQKHPVISGGCKSCACMQTFVWRLTFAGRQHIQNQETSHE